MNQLEMLEKMYTCIRDSKETSLESFETLVAYVAGKFTFKVPINIPWIRMEALQELDKLFDLELLREDPWDWFGELDSKLKLGLLDKNLLIDKATTQAQAAQLKLYGNPVEPHHVLDDNAYTGRHIIEMWKNEKHVIYYGVESDLLAYRIALVNMKCYGINSSIIYGNSFEHDVRPFSPNWRDANNWEPNKNRITVAETDERLKQVDGFYRIV